MMAYADLTDVRCHYELTGSGEPLLLIPGLGVTSSVWESAAPELAKHFTLILPDNRGVGRSKPKREPHTLRDFSADLVELLDHLQVDRCHVMGLSLGGVIAQRLASDHPGRVHRLVLVSCTDRFTPYLRHIATLLGGTLRGRRAAGMFARAVEILGSSPECLDACPDVVEQRVAAKCAQRVPPRAVATQLRCLAAADLDLERDPITAPTLVLAGEHDVLIPSCYARRMSLRIADSRFMLVRGAGHNPLVEKPEVALAEITRFLETGKSSVARSPAGKREPIRAKVIALPPERPSNSPAAAVAAPTGGGSRP
jgi:pimeloyl-ACP methyl ester carboxylesterase